MLPLLFPIVYCQGSLGAPKSWGRSYHSSAWNLLMVSHLNQGKSHSVDPSSPSPPHTQTLPSPSLWPHHLPLFFPSSFCLSHTVLSSDLQMLQWGSCLELLHLLFPLCRTFSSSTSCMACYLTPSEPFAHMPPFQRSSFLPDQSFFSTLFFSITVTTISQHTTRYTASPYYNVNFTEANTWSVLVIAVFPCWTIILEKSY